MISRPVEAIIFDCDGVLVDSESLCHQGLSVALRAEGIEESSDTLIREFRGVELARIFSAIEHRHGKSLPSGFERQYRAIVADLFDRELRPTAGIEALLKRLAVPFCVASNGPREKIEHALKLTGLRHYFGEQIYSGFEVTRWKPDPDLFLVAAHGLGVAAANCLVVEDSEVGLQAAKSAGMSMVRYAPSGQAGSEGVWQIGDLMELALLPGLFRN